MDTNEEKRMVRAAMRRQRIVRQRAMMAGTMMGMITGAAAAFLLAPRSGPETQQALAEQGQAIRKEAERRVDQARSDVEQGVTKARSSLADWLEQGSSLLAQGAEQVRS